MNELNIIVSEYGTMSVVNEKFEINTKLLFGKGLDDKNKEWFVNYLDFDVKVTASNVGSVKEEHVNLTKLKMIKYYMENFYGTLLFKSSSNRRDTLYKAILNVKGKDIVLTPKVKLII